VIQGLLGGLWCTGSLVGSSLIAIKGDSSSIAGNRAEITDATIQSVIVEDQLPIYNICP
jgi:hypothetical protein